MRILQNAYKLTVRQRRVVAFLVMTFVLTNAHVSAARAADGVTELPIVAADIASSASPLTGELPAANEKPPIVIRTIRMAATAYNSLPGQTDGSPFVTASGSCVHDGIVASNAFPIGTKIRLPELFGDKVFTVEDRMNERYTNHVDIWMTSPEDARAFGLKHDVKLEVIQEGDGKKHWGEGWTDKTCQTLAKA